MQIYSVRNMPESNQNKGIKDLGVPLRRAGSGFRHSLFRPKSEKSSDKNASILHARNEFDPERLINQEVRLFRTLVIVNPRHLI